MIEKIIITRSKDLPTEWWNEVRWLKKKTEIEFRAGLNIIFGPNASGKSTLLTLIARTMHCEQAGYSHITEESVTKMIKDKSFNISLSLKQGEKEFKGYDIIHDGQPTFYLSAEHTMGLQQGKINDNFIREGLLAVTEEPSLSSANKMVYKLHQLNQQLTSINEVEGTDFIKSVNDIWYSFYDKATRILLNPQLKKSKKTILMDEPDRSMDTKNQKDLWNMLEALSGNYQVIVVTHSPFALERDANYIETKKDYVKKYTRTIKDHFNIRI